MLTTWNTRSWLRCPRSSSSGSSARRAGASSRLANAVRMSATFPYITSSVCLPTSPPRHVVDAGYYDNYGVNLAAAWIASHSEWITSNTNGVLVIQTRAFRNEKRIKVLSEEIHANAEDALTTSWQQDLVKRAVGFIPWLTSNLASGVQSVVMPLEGVAKARDSSMYFRNDEQLRGLKNMFTDLTDDDQFFRSVIFTCDTIQYGQKVAERRDLELVYRPAGIRPDPPQHGALQLAIGHRPGSQRHALRQCREVVVRTRGQDETRRAGRPERFANSR